MSIGKPCGLFFRKVIRSKAAASQEAPGRRTSANELPTQVSFGEVKASLL